MAGGGGGGGEACVATAADGTHPTGMHSSCVFIHMILFAFDSAFGQCEWALKSRGKLNHT